LRINTEVISTGLVKRAMTNIDIVVVLEVCIIPVIRISELVLQVFTSPVIKTWVLVLAVVTSPVIRTSVLVLETFGLTLRLLVQGL
jgi:hypothetical protein